MRFGNASPLSFRGMVRTSGETGAGSVIIIPMKSPQS